MTTPTPDATQLWRWASGTDAPLLTVGHGTLTGEAVAGLLARAAVRLLVDVRRYPASRRDPSVSRDALHGSMAAHGIAYRWEERLGGRRHGSGTGNAGLRNPSFRA